MTPQIARVNPYVVTGLSEWHSAMTLVKSVWFVCAAEGDLPGDGLCLVCQWLCVSRCRTVESPVWSPFPCLCNVYRWLRLLVSICVHPVSMCVPMFVRFCVGTPDE